MSLQLRGDLTCPDRRGSGAFKWDLAEAGEIPLWVADMDFAVAPEITAALHRRLSHPVYGYTAVPEAYKEAVLGWVASRQGWHPDLRHLLVLPGIMPAISLAIRTFTVPGEGVATFSPVYFPFFDVIRETGRQTVAVPLLERDGDAGSGDGAGLHYEIDLDALERALPQCRVLLLCSPQNPGGRVWTAAELEAVAACAARHEVLVIADEIHGDLTFPQQQFTPFLSVPGDDRYRLALQAPSKTFNIPGLPTAWAVIPDPRRRRAFKRTQEAAKLDLSNILSLTAAHAGYTAGAPWLDSVRQQIYDNYLLVRTELEQLPGVRVYRMEGTYIAWVKTGLPSEELSARGRAGGVWVMPGRRFGPEGEGHLRVNVATDPALLFEGLQRLKSVLSEAHDQV